MLRLKELSLIGNCEALRDIPKGKVLINTINAHSYNTAQKDKLFADALRNGDFLIPDGAGIVMACRWLGCSPKPEQRVSGWDLFMYEMQRLDREAAEKGKRKVMFLGSSEMVLRAVKMKTMQAFPNLETETYSPPYKEEFSEQDSREMVMAVNRAAPDLLWIGMTAPKQEKWAYEHLAELDIDCHVGTIGAVFDFFAGTIRRAPLWWQRHSLEWLYRLVMEPRRMWRRYLIGNVVFLWNVWRIG